MKKILISVVFGLLIISTTQVFATSGACSSHLGVNCSYGATTLGKVMCNDGWINSSVYFSDMDECKDTTDYCPDVLSNPMSCYTESDYARVQAEVDGARGTSRAIAFRSGSFGNDWSTLFQDKLDNCRFYIDNYKAMIDSRNRCLERESGPTYEQIQQQITDAQNVATQLAEDKAQCLRSTNNKGYLDTKNICQCPTGTSLIQGDCRTPLQTCVLWHGEFSVDGPNSTCICKPGYIIASDGSAKCVSIMPVSANTPTAQINNTQTSRVETPVQTVTEITKSKTTASSPVSNSQKSVVTTTNSSSSDPWFDNWYKTTHATTSNDSGVKKEPWYMRLWKFFWRF